MEPRSPEASDIILKTARFYRRLVRLACQVDQIYNERSSTRIPRILTYKYANTCLSKASVLFFICASSEQTVSMMLARRHGSPARFRGLETAGGNRNEPH